MALNWLLRSWLAIGSMVNKQKTVEKVLGQGYNFMTIARVIIAVMAQQRRDFGTESGPVAKEGQIRTNK